MTSQKGTPITIQRTISEIVNKIENVRPKSKRRLAEFVIKYEKEFPPNTLERSLADVTTWALLDTPLMMYAINMTGPAIIETHGILESRALMTVRNGIANEKHRDVVEEILRRRNLSDFGRILLQLEIINKSDLKHIIKLSNLRNGIAHRNEKSVSKMISNGKPIHPLNLDHTVNKVDFFVFLINTIKILVKLFNASRSFEKSKHKEKT